MRPLSMLAASAALAVSLPAQWAQLTPTTFPSQRRSGAAAFDASANRLIFYGGVSPTPSVILPQTWAYNGTWTQLNPAGGSLGRWGHQLVKSPTSGRLVTFGGRSPTITGYANDTYEWTGSAWQNVPTPVVPPARYLYGMCHDSVRNRVVMFGGRNNSTTLGDCWEYDGVTWVQRSFPTLPSPREEMAMVYDASQRVTVLFGGNDSDTATVLGDTWHYDGTTWTEMTALENAPSPRYRAASIYDSTRNRVVLYGGYTGTAISTSTFEYTGSTWNTVTTTTAPAASTETLHGYDPVRRKFVLFGGFGGTFSNQTWEYTGANTGFFSTFGNSCQTPVGEATLTSNTPRINNTWTVTANNLPLDLELVLFTLGFSDVTWGAIPLPFDLALLGLPGCDLAVSADVINISGATTPGSASNDTPIPNNTALLNQRLYVQGILLDVTPTFEFVYTGTTKAGRAVIGS